MILSLLRITFLSLHSQFIINLESLIKRFLALTGAMVLIEIILSYLSMVTPFVS
jgi:hypothetical protein